MDDEYKWIYRLVAIFLLMITPALSYGQINSDRPNWYEEMRSLTSYFPNLVLDEEQSVHDFRAIWYAKYLQAMDEPSLWKTRKNGLHTYRFLWLRSFHKPICIRLTINRNGSGTIFAKKTSGRGGYETGDLADYKTKALEIEKVDQFLRKIESIRFWELPTWEKVYGLDGAQWILEGVRDGKYHIVDRFSPGGDFAATALLLIKYSGLEVGPIY